MIKEIFGKKVGMTQIFTEEGALVSVTVVEVEPACVLERQDYPNKTVARIGCFKVDPRRVSKMQKPVVGYFNKLGIDPYKVISEVTVESDADFNFEVAEPEPEQPQTEDQNVTPESEETAAPAEGEQAPEGTEDTTNAENPAAESTETPAEDQAPEAQESPEAEAQEADQEEPEPEGVVRSPREFGVEIFTEGEIVHVRGKTKGKGFAGGMKRHGWSGQPKSHGSTMHRRIGSTGASAYPSKIIKGLRMPGHMGAVYRTVRNVRVEKVDAERNLLLLRGGIPGSRGSIVRIRKG